MEPRKVLLPEVRSFGELFAYLGEWRNEWTGGPYDATGRLREDRPAPQYLAAGNDIVGRILEVGGFPGPAPEDRNEIGPYCSMRLSAVGGPAHRSIAVRATDRALAAVAPHLVTSDDQLSWRIIGHADGRALVILEHGQIIGSHWLAYIDPATIPAPVSDEAARAMVAMADKRAPNVADAAAMIREGKARRAAREEPLDRMRREESSGLEGYHTVHTAGRNED